MHGCYFPNTQRVSIDECKGIWRDSPKAVLNVAEFVMNFFTLSIVAPTYENGNEWKYHQTDQIHLKVIYVVTEQ